MVSVESKGYLVPGLVLALCQIRKTERRDWQKFGTSFNSQCIDFMDLTGNERVLSVGMGRGSLEADLKRVHPEIGLWGVEIDEGELNQAIGWGDFKLAPALIQADGKRLPFPNEVFDVVCCRNVLKQDPDYSLIIEEMARRVISGGRLVVFETVALDKEHQKFLDQVVAIAEKDQGKFWVDADLFAMLDSIVEKHDFCLAKGIRYDRFASSFIGAHYLKSLGFKRDDPRVEQIFDLYKEQTPQILLKYDLVQFLPNRENIWDVWSDQIWAFYQVWKN